MIEDAELTELIQRMQSGDRDAGHSLFTAAAARLRRMARSLMSREQTNGFDASDLVQEVFAQKVSGTRLRTAVGSREHFYSLMASGMRQVLADRGRKRKARKRQAPPIEHLLIVLREDSRMVELSAALRKLEKIDPDGCKLIQMKYQHRVTWDELAQVTGRSIWQVRAECDYVLRWLRAELA